MLAAQVLQDSGAFLLTGRLIKLIIWCPKGFQGYWPAWPSKTVRRGGQTDSQSPKETSTPGVGPSFCSPNWGSGFYLPRVCGLGRLISTFPREQWFPASRLQKPSRVFTPGYVSIFPCVQARSKFYTCLSAQILQLPGEPSCRLVLELLDFEARIYSVLSRVLVIAKRNSVAAGSLWVWNGFRTLLSQAKA